MRQKQDDRGAVEKAVREIKRRTRRRFSPEDKIRIVLQGLRGGRCPKLSCRLGRRVEFILRHFLLVRGSSVWTSAENRCQSPEIVITHDLPEILLGQQKRSCHPAQRHLAVAPAANIASLFPTPDCGLSMRFVVARQRWRLGGTSARLIVKVSSNPSRKLAAAAG